jgi:DNA-binding MarR family transcriptional regulator
MVLNEEGRVSSSEAARALGVAASTVTRLADRLLASGHLRRGADRSNRSVVTLESTVRGRAVVEQVKARRQGELRRVLDQLDPTERSDCAATLRQIHECLVERRHHPLSVRSCGELPARGVAPAGVVRHHVQSVHASSATTGSRNRARGLCRGPPGSAGTTTHPGHSPLPPHPAIDSPKIGGAGLDLRATVREGQRALVRWIGTAHCATTPSLSDKVLLGEGVRYGADLDGRRGCCQADPGPFHGHSE